MTSSMTSSMFRRLEAMVTAQTIQTELLQRILGCVIALQPEEVQAELKQTITAKIKEIRECRK